MNLLINFKKYRELKERFRDLWDCGSNGASKGVQIFNLIVRTLHTNNSFTVRKIIHDFYIENSDLVELKPSKLVSYLDYENKILYNKKR